MLGSVRHKLKLWDVEVGVPCVGFSTWIYKLLKNGGRLPFEGVHAFSFIVDSFTMWYLHMPWRDAQFLFMDSTTFFCSAQQTYKKFGSSACGATREIPLLCESCYESQTSMCHRMPLRRHGGWQMRMHGHGNLALRCVLLCCTAW